MYAQFAAVYDAIYSFKNYEAESQTIRRLIEQHARGTATTLLDMACGTGKHLAFLQSHYTVMGLDISPEMLAIARQRCPGAAFHQGDMAAFDLGVQVDAIMCLFGAIGYVQTEDRLRQAVACMARHLRPGGVVMVDPWFSPATWLPGTLHASFVDEPELKIARMTISESEGRLSRNVFHFMVGTPQGITTFTETHELGLFTVEEYLDAFRAAGLDTIRDPDGLIGRGMFIGVRP